MKAIKISLVCGLLLYFGCAPTETADNLIPEDLAGKKELLKAKQKELSKLTGFIQEIEAAIGQQDPASIKSTRKVVTTQTIKPALFEHFIEVQGTVESDDMVDASPETGGRIKSLNVKEGDYVKKGQLIATLDLEQVKKQIAELEKSLELANTVYERQDRLWKQNIGSEMQYLEAKNNKERLEKSIETINYQLTKSDVFAPISGVVEREILQVGEVAAPGMPIIQILNTNKLKVAVDVPENYLSIARKGDRVKIFYPALDKTQEARISQVGRTIDRDNRTFEVEVNLPSAGSLKPNLLAIMYIKDFEMKDALTIPVESLLQEVNGRDYVLTAESTSEGFIAKKKYVETGKSFGEEIVISNGLKDGDVLILDGARNVDENEELEIQNAK